MRVILRSNNGKSWFGSEIITQRKTIFKMSSNVKLLKKDIFTAQYLKEEWRQISVKKIKI